MSLTRMTNLNLLVLCLLCLPGAGSEGNLALDKNATQKSTMRHWRLNKNYYNNTAEKAVDGLIHTNDPEEEGCASTAYGADMDAWWMVDLGRVYVITNITVYNRKGSYHRLRDFWIRVGNSSDITRHADCTYKSGWIEQGASGTFTCDRTLSGRWVSIQRTNDLAEDRVHGNGFLQLCEVQVYGYQYTASATTTAEATTSTAPTTSQTTNPSSIDGRSSTSEMGPSPQDGSTMVNKVTNSQSGDDMKKEPMLGVIIGASVAAAVVLIIAIIVILILYIRRRKQPRTDEPDYHQVVSTKNEASDNIDAMYSQVVKKQKPPPSKAVPMVTPVSMTNPTFTMKDEETAGPSVSSPGASPDNDTEDEGTEDEQTPELHKKTFNLEQKQPREENVYMNRTANQYSIAVSKLIEIVNEKKQKGALKSEFKELPKEASHSHKEGSEPENKLKNRYRNIKAYDKTRVVLKTLDEDPRSNYINANYIDGYNNKPKHYVATQGPNNDTMVDFWRMIWEINANRIIMVTNLFEMGKSKVEQYWPSKKGTSKTYGDIEVTLDEVLGLADHTVHTLSVRHKVQEETRKTWQLHFTSWPDKGIPRQAAALLNFRSRVHSYDEKGTGPLVVHCSAGVGRTGTYIALDILLEQVKDQDEIDIFSLVLQLREQRMMMVQTQEQYVFLHDALIEQLYSKDTPIPTPLFREKFNFRLKVNPETGKNELQEEFERLAELRVPPIQEKCEGLLPVNKHKNRDKFIVPPNNARAFLMTPVEERNSYINAVFVDGYMAKDSFLVTQHPLADTVVDLWRMIYDYKCQTVVMLNQTDEKDVPYWPSGDDNEITVEPFKIEVEKVDSKNPAFTIRTLELTHTGTGKSQKLQHFHFHGWTYKDELPLSIPDFISLMEAVSSWYKKTQEEATGGRKQMVVHCLDGNSKSGIFCVVYSILDQIRVNQDVNIFQAVRLARMNRYQFITSVDQYKFCYDAAQQFLNQEFETYANFAR